MFSSYAGLVTTEKITPVDRIKHQQIDLTGTIASFFKKERFGYYRKRQVLTLSYPAFAFKPDPTAATSNQFGLVVSYVSGIISDGEKGGNLEYLPGGPTEDKQCVWWFDDQDDSAMSTAHLYWNNPSVAFNGVLVRQIKISLPYTVTQAEVTVQYQSFINDRTALVSKSNEDKTLISKSNEDETSKLNEDNTEGPVNTKEAVAVLQREVKFLEERLNSVYRNYVGASDSTPELLEADPTGRKEDNYVRNELHYMDVDKTIIIPSNGAFYPGTASEGNLLKVVVPKVEFGAVTQDDIASGSRLGWLFCYMVNNLFVYEPTHDPKPVNGESYYLITPYGTYEKIEVEEGDTWKSIRDRYSEGDNAGKYLTKDIFVRSNSKYNPELNFDGTINHTASRVSREEQVILTDKNINRYLNYSGKFIDVNAQSPESRVLEIDKDYVIAGLDAVKTASTLRQEPVYTKIRLLNRVAADSLYVSISYQAYGGMVTVESIQQIQKEVKNLSKLMMDQKFLTVDQFESHAAIRRLNIAVTALNDYIGNFYQAVYRVPFKSTVNKDTITKMQWMNIALLKDPAWLTKLNGRSECGQFRVSSKVQGWSHDFTVAIDLDRILSSNSSQHACHGVFKVISNTIPKYREDEDIIVNPDEDERIALRLCWNGNGKESGLMLQLGWDFFAYSEKDYKDNNGIDEITVVNKSGGVTNWTVISAEDSGIDGEMDRVRVYNRIQYEKVPVTNSEGEKNHLEPGTVYFVPEMAYTYFATQDKTVQNTKTYYTRQTTSGIGGLGYKYEPATNLKVGVNFTEYSGTYYERIERLEVYRAYTVAERTPVTKEHNVYLPVFVSLEAGKSSYDSDSFFFDNYIGTKTAKAATWTASNMELTDSHYAISLLETTKEGILAWSGSIPLSRWSSAPGIYRKPINLHSFITQQMQDSFVKENVEEAVLVIYDAMQGVDRKIRVPLSCSSKKVALYGEAFFCPQDLCTIEFIMPTPDEITLYTELGIASQTQERFDLRSIWIRFK